MVEGPGATRNGRKAQNALGMQVVRADYEKIRSLSVTLVGRCLIEAFSVGKEVFLIFSALNDDPVSRESRNVTSTKEDSYRMKEIAVRLHFGMNGCLYVGSGGRSPQVPKWKQNDEATLKINFQPKSEANFSLSSQRKSFDSGMSKTLDNFFPLISNEGSAELVTGCAGHKRTRDSMSQTGDDVMRRNSSLVTIEATGTTISIHPSPETVRAKFARLMSRDSCSSSFDARSVFDVIRDAGRVDASLIVSDAVLNQELFPGVGNIIKIEGLHKARVNPRRHVASLSDGELRRVVLHCRLYSMAWLKCGRAPAKLVYNQTVCGTCKTSSVSMQKLGGGPVNTQHQSNHAYMSRVTFWCPICQPSSVGGDTAIHAGASCELTKSSVPIQPNHRPVISCPAHGPTRVMIRRVRKLDSPNASRLFRTCKGCQFFAWADSHFPSCACQKKTILRISKTERSGGRWFLSCAHGKTGSTKDGCGMFEWAKPSHLQPLGSLLTPLL